MSDLPNFLNELDSIPKIKKNIAKSKHLDNHDKRWALEICDTLHRYGYFAVEDSLNVFLAENNETFGLEKFVRYT